MTSGNHAARSPSSIPNSKLVSHWIASWSCGIDSRIAGQLCEDARPRSSVRRAWSSGATKALIGASGVGRDTWNRQPRGTRPPASARGRRDTSERRLGVAERVERELRPLALAQREAGQRPVEVLAPAGRSRTAGRELSTGYCHTIQSARGPVSPSGRRRSRSPRAEPRTRNTSSELPSGTLPTSAAAQRDHDGSAPRSPRSARLPKRSTTWATSRGLGTWVSGLIGLPWAVDANPHSGDVAELVLRKWLCPPPRAAPAVRPGPRAPRAGWNKAEDDVLVPRDVHERLEQTPSAHRRTRGRACPNSSPSGTPRSRSPRSRLPRPARHGSSHGRGTGIAPARDVRGTVRCRRRRSSVVGIDAAGPHSPRTDGSIDRSRRGLRGHRIGHARHPSATSPSTSSRRIVAASANSSKGSR